MTLTDALKSVKYVTDATGNKTEVIIPVEDWETVLTAWKKLVELLEDREDRAILEDWLQKRAAGKAKMISLETLEQELIDDGLLPG